MEDASAVAADLGAADAFHGGLTLCPAGARLAEQLGLSGTECQTMEFWGATDARTEPWTIELLVRQPSLRAALGALARRCFPPAHYVRPVLGRPGRLWLALGYVVRLREAVRFAVRFPAPLSPGPACPAPPRGRRRKNV